MLTENYLVHVSKTVPRLPIFYLDVDCVKFQIVKDKQTEMLLY